jgi:hypothetical protein
VLNWSKVGTKDKFSTAKVAKNAKKPENFCELCVLAVEILVLALPG